MTIEESVRKNIELANDGEELSRIILDAALEIGIAGEILNSSGSLITRGRRCTSFLVIETRTRDRVSRT